MKIRVTALLMSALVLLSLSVFAEAGQKNTHIEASGALEERVFVVSVPTELALLTADKGSGTGSSMPSSRSNKPVGRVDAVNVEHGATVKRGDVLFSVAGELASANLAAAQAQYEQTLATIENLAGARGDLAESRRELSQTEADLKAKRAEAERTFNSKYAEGRAKVGQLRERLAAVNAGLGQAQAGLLAAEEAENDARKMLDAAERLPDTDPTKLKSIEQASAMLQGALKQQESLSSTVRQLSKAKAQLNEGISGAEKSLASGKQQFMQGVATMDSALAKITEGREKIHEGSSKITGKMRVLQKRRDQAEVGLSLARKVKEASDIKAAQPGRVRDLKAYEGMVAYPGQWLMAIANEDRLRLEVYLPVGKAARVTQGSEAEVRIDGAPDSVFVAKVVGIGGKAIFAPSNLSSGELELIRVVRIIIEVTNKDGVLKAGMPADARISVGK